MGRTNKNNTELGDVHAPVEDTEAPLSLKLLVFIMVLALGGMTANILHRLKIF